MRLEPSYGRIVVQKLDNKILNGANSSVIEIPKNTGIFVGKIVSCEKQEYHYNEDYQIGDVVIFLKALEIELEGNKLYVVATEDVMCKVYNS
jgi:co-chaperonin GroES (HSP10)